MTEQNRKLNNAREINKEIIDEELEYWMKAVTTSIDQTTPKRTYKITPNIKETYSKKNRKPIYQPKIHNKPLD